ncbi:hypothetical protein ACJMK2_038290 [Sinanodonta woodiana]|uniref:DNA 3'-5' helicase n=2 Tax=Sinanodonta woodiana TaxID=1069815 RepID=A0ABD3W9E5_SINWO
MALFESEILRIKSKYGLSVTLKLHQEAIIRHLIERKDVFVLLPTGFGKSLTYILVPLLLDELYPGKVHTAVVVSPLKALMADQVKFLRSHGIKAMAITEETSVKEIRENEVSVLYTSPEAAILQKWMKILKEQFKDNICILVFDEAHCISSWGLDFRPGYRQVSVIQSLFDVPNLVLTATATKEIQRDIYDVLGFHRETTFVVSDLPNRPNIFIDLKECSEKYETELEWILNLLLKWDTRHKIIVYVRSINMCYQLYLWLVTRLMEKCFVGEEAGPSNRRVEMFHANTDKESKERIINQFVKEDGTIEVLISTVAFGMGINIPNIDIVVHWGLPSSCISYWQEVGRCARDGRKGYAVCYAFKRSQSSCKDDTLKELALLSKCLRCSVLSNFLLDGMDNQSLKMLEMTGECSCVCDVVCSCDKCKCCIVCQNSCSCKSKVREPLISFLC